MQRFDPYNTRLVKVPLPIPVVREIDELVVTGVGGYSDRNDFIREAINNMLAELRYQTESLWPSKRLITGSKVG